MKKQPQQGSYSNPVAVTNKEFIDGVFHDVPVGAYIYGTVFRTPPEKSSNGVWFGGVLTERSLTKKNDYNNGSYNTFFVVSTFYANEEGQVRRRKAQFAAAHVITMDDLGSGMSAKIPWSEVKLPPSYVLETSPDNCQAGYIFSKCERDGDKFNRVVNALVYQGLSSPTDPGMVGQTRFVRLPMGSNTKEKYGAPFKHVMRYWNPSLTYTLQDIIDAYGLVLSPPTPVRSYKSATIDIHDDPYVKVLSDLGLILTGEVKNAGDGRQMLDILCPFHNEHSDRIDEGAAYFVGGGFKCFHGHCENRTFKDVKEILRKNNWVDTEELDHKLRSLKVGSLFTEKTNV